MFLTKPRVKETTVIYDDYFRIEKDHLLIPDQEDYHYYTVVADPIAVMALATTPEGRYVLNWEYRHPAKKTLLSCPGGIMNSGESPLACAERELWEETGYRAENFEIIGESYPFPGICTQKTVFVRAKNAFNTGSYAREHAEFIEETVLMTLEEIKSRVKTAPVDGLLLSALFFESVI